MKLNSYKLNAARGAYCKWLRSEVRTIYQAYQNPSVVKEMAFEDCFRKLRLYNGEDIKIILYSIQFFTVGFVFEDTRTAEKMFYYITPNYDIIIPVSSITSKEKPIEIMKKFPIYYEH